CYGRWDNSDHSLYASPELFPAGNLDGLDSNKPWSYYGFNEKIGGWGDFRNPGIPDVCDGIGVRSEHPRQPWHDIHSRIVGESAVDLANNFRERWEFQRDTDWVNEDALVNTDGNLPFDFPGVTIWENRTGPHNTPIQILRSIDAKTADVPTETDIMQGYRNIIDEAEHYLYIENQFFISNFEPSSTTDPIIVNDIATKIAERVIRAIDEGKKFKVYIVVPVHSEGIISSDTKGINNYHTDFVVQGTIRRQLETVYRGSDSMIGKIAQRLAGTGNTITQAHLDGVGDYLRIYNLRTYGADIHSTNHSRYFPNVTPMTNQVYVHSKMMIADDRVALIGSANINDRSLLGDRDSEIAAMFAEGEPCWGVMNGEYYPCSKKVREFRIKIWKELLGENDVDNISDPVSETCFTETWKKIADDNTAIYEDVFPDIASNKPAQYTPRSRNIQYWRGEHAKKSQLFGIRGFVTNYPWQHWLKDMVPTVLPTYVLESTYDILIAMNGPNIGVGSEEDWLV
ncbi:MAG TPA: hypothetical protein EYN30_04760, partial [Candidatus Poseidoniales archaeon]|nr:hypothetical protein [Candidatus Poseidoniales archaeon]